MAPAWRLTTWAAESRSRAGSPCGQQQRRRTVDRRQRVAQFVRQHREEPVLGGVGSLQFAARQFVLLQCLQQLGPAALQRLLLAGRTALDTFTEEELLRAKAVAFWAAAALRRAQLLAQVRRYATLLEQVVEVDQRVFRGDGPEALSPAILEGACRIGGYRGGMLVLQTPRGPGRGRDVGRRLRGVQGRPAPSDLASVAARRLPAARMLDVAESLGAELPAQQVFLVPLATADGWLGCLVLLDPNGESPDDRLLEAYASRAAAAWRHAATHHAPPLSRGREGRPPSRRAASPGGGGRRPRAPPRGEGARARPRRLHRPARGGARCVAGAATRRPRGPGLVRCPCRRPGRSSPSPRSPPRRSGSTTRGRSSRRATRSTTC